MSFKVSLWCVAGAVLWGGQQANRAAEAVPPALPTSSAPVAAMGEYNLADFGPVGSRAEAQGTLRTAMAQIVAKGGGILVIGPGADLPTGSVHVNALENNAPSSCRGAPSVTIVDRRDGYESVLVPSNGKTAENGVWAGHRLSRTVRQPIDMAFGVHSTESIDTSIAGGTTSYMQPCALEIKKGADQRIYLPTVRGLFEGMHLVIRPPTQQDHDVVVKSLGWDAEKKLFYAVGDVTYDHPKGAFVLNKHVVNSLSITDECHSDNQSMALMVQRHNYGVGDSFAISAGQRSMGNIMSGHGDEGGLCFAADIYNDLSPFRGKVASIDWAKAELVYDSNAEREDTLGTSRPIVNMNAAKRLTNGVVRIVPPENLDWGGVTIRDPAETVRGYVANGIDLAAFTFTQQEGGVAKPKVTDCAGRPVSAFPYTYQGKAYPSILADGANYLGGRILASADCGWSDEIVGRFFAVDEPSEYLDPKHDHGCGYTAAPATRAYRWYLIAEFRKNPDGACVIKLERVRWAAVNAGAPNLYLRENYTWDGHDRPLRYVIAPGAYVADVSRAWTRARNGSPRTLKLAPSPDAGGEFDFAKGDPIVQAIGQDPWNVTGLRIRHHNHLPSTIADSSIQVVNLGRVAVDSALCIAGQGGDLERCRQQMKDGQPVFRKGIEIGAATCYGIHFVGDVDMAALMFEQPNGRAQPMVWKTANPTPSSLTVDPQQGVFTFAGGEVAMPGVKLSGGISAGDKAARNLRGIAVAVKAGAKELDVRFPRAEEDAAYSLYVQPTWVTSTGIARKTADGFVVVFDKAPPVDAALDWILVR